MWFFVFNFYSMSIYEDYEWYKKQKPKHQLSFNNFYVKISRWDSMESVIKYKPRAYEANKLWKQYKRSCQNPVSKIYFLSCYRKWMRWEELFWIQSKWKCTFWYSDQERQSKLQKKINKKRKEQWWYKDEYWQWQIKNKQ